MIKRLIVKNFRTLANCAIEFPRTALLMGNNGTGKTSVFDVLWGIRRIVVENASCESVFPIHTLSRWMTAETGNVPQEFALTLGSPHGDLHYRLVVEQNPQEGKSRIAVESLRDAEGDLFLFDHGKVQLYRDDHSPGATFTYDWARSALSGVAPSRVNQKLTHFRERMAQLCCIRIDAPRLSARSEREQTAPERDFSNFASWYRAALQSNTAANGPFLQELQEVIRGFRSLNLHFLGQGFAMLQAKMVRGDAKTHARGHEEYDLAFDELSDGQRALIALYAILHFLLPNDEAIVCLDEPDSFLALEEVQPFVHRLLDQVETNKAQVIVASHHPELYDLLARDTGIRMMQDDTGCIVASPYEAPPDTVLTVSELIAMGDLS